MFRRVTPIRRLLCRLSFLLVCAAPTILVGAWGAAWRLPSHRREYEQRISHELGLDVRLGEVAHPRPGLTVLRGLRATQLEAGHVVADVQQISAASNGVGVVVVISGAKFDALALSDGWQALERALSRRPATSSGPVRLVANELTLCWPDRQETLTSVAGRLETLPDGPQATFEWRMAGGDSLQLMRFAMFRSRNFDPPQTGVKFDTGDSSLDLSLLAPTVPVPQWLGPKAKFSGELWARRGPDGWNGSLRGDLADIDLATLIAERGPHDIRGAANLHIDDAQFRGSRLLSADGLIEAGPGFIGKSFLQALAGSLDLRTPANDSSFPRAILPFERLAGEFSLSAEGITLLGCCRDSLPGVVIADDKQPLLDTANGQPRPVERLAQLFASPGDPVVPLNVQARGLLDLLPASPERAVRRPGDRFHRVDNSPPPDPLEPP